MLKNIPVSYRKLLDNFEEFVGPLLEKEKQQDSSFLRKFSYEYRKNNIEELKFFIDSIIKINLL